MQAGPMETSTIQGGVIVAVTAALYLFRKLGSGRISQEAITAVCRITSMGVAALTAVGVTFSMEGNFEAGGKIVLAFPAMADLIKHGLEQYIAQDYIHQRFGKPREEKRKQSISGIIPPGTIKP